MLTSTPASITGPIHATRAAAASIRNGAVLSPSDIPEPRNPTTSAYVHTTKNTPTVTALSTTARGIVRNGRCASTPNVVALSNPTKLNTASITPSRTPLAEAPCSRTCATSTLNPCRTSTNTTTTAISETDVSSTHNITRAENRTSPDANRNAPTPATIANTTAGTRTVPRNNWHEFTKPPMTEAAVITYAKNNASIATEAYPRGSVSRVYTYSDPGEADVLANAAIGSDTSTIAPIAITYASQLPLPASANTSGTVSAGVVLGAIVDIDCASTSIGESAPRRSPYDSGTGSGAFSCAPACTSIHSPLKRIRYAASMDYRSMLNVALEEARTGFAEGGIPIGAAIFRADGTLVSSGRNRRVQQDDPSIHGETDAFRRAGRQRSYRDLIMVTTLAPCWYCTGLVRQFGFGKVIVGESRTFSGGVASLRELGIEVIDLDSDDCRLLLEEFIARHPEIWNEDIGVV